MKKFYRNGHLGKITALAVLLLAAAACDAPRENPLDPENPGNKLITIEGTVKTVGFPNSPIEGVEVFFTARNLLTHTDQNGNFSITDYLKQNGKIYINKIGFSPDTVDILWNGDSKQSFQIFLNSIPVIDSLEFYSSVENRYQFSPNYNLFIKARISDYDGTNDIDSVFLSCPEIKFSKRLRFNSSANFFEERFFLSDLNILSLEEIIGKTFVIKVKDLAKRVFNITEANIKRIVNQEIQTISPLNGEPVNNPVELKWKRLTAGFGFNYKLEVYTDELPPQLVWTKEYVARDSISYKLDNDLPAGDYFWVIWCIDDFKNRGRSKPASFRIL